MTELDAATTDAAVIAELATRAQTPVDTGLDGLVVAIGPDGVPQELDLASYMDSPRRTVAARTVADVPSLLAYLHRHDPLPEQADTAGNGPTGAPPRATGAYDPDTRPVTLWADERRRQVRAVLDDSIESGPGWQAHICTLGLELDEDWTKWTGRHGVLMSQEEAAEFIEDLLHTVVEPDAADLLEVVSSLQVHRQMVVGQTVQLRSGATQITYSDDDTASAGHGTLEVPSRFTVQTPVFAGAPATQFTCRFRYRQQGRALKVAYLIDRRRQIERGAFAAVIAQISATGRPVLFGTPWHGRTRPDRPGGSCASPHDPARSESVDRAGF